MNLKKTYLVVCFESFIFFKYCILKNPTINIKKKNIGSIDSDKLHIYKYDEDIMYHYYKNNIFEKKKNF